MAKSIVFIDTEVGVDDHKIHDIGAVRQDRAYFHSASVRNFVEFIAGAEYICGHNILHHDLKYIHDSLGYELRVTVIDTLYLSPLLFPKRPYHALLKDDKLQTEQLNDPVNDCQKAASLFYDEVNAFFDLPPKVKQIFCCLLYDHPEFSGFFQYVNFRPYKAKIYELIHMEYEGRICTNADLLPLIRHYPVELAYALALIGAIVALANSFAKTIQDRMKLAPVEAVREDCGIVRITHHHEKHMETAVVNEVISTQGNSQCCILTNTNDEALRLLGLLTKSGIRAKLIQSLDGFRLYNLVEVRYFLKKIDAGLKSPVISNDLWNRAKEHLFDAYAGSPCLEICGNLIRDFEETNPTKYRTDLEEFIRESNYEDFYPDDHEIVFISTIHKAKGREFDTVYMMLDGNTAATDEEKRKLYVGMTRAKNALYIHCNTELFSAIAIPEIEYIEDQNCYEEPTELTLQLTHRDVVLDFFKGKKELLLKLRSGMALSLIDCYLLAKLNGKTVRIAKLSKACKDRIESLLSKGYCPVSAEIRFIVAWKKEGDADETPVVLPDIHFQKELSIK